MIKNLLGTLLVSCTLLILASCGKTSEGNFIVPEDASVVVYINSESLSSKLSWDEIKATKWFQEASKKADDSTSKMLLDDPEKSGLSTKAPFVFFYKKESPKSAYVALQAVVKDAKDLEAMLKEATKNDDVKFSKEGDINYMTKDDGDGVVAWTSERVFLIGDASDKGYDYDSRFDMPRDSSDPAIGGPAIENTPAKKLDLKAIAKTLHGMKTNEGLIKDDRFAKLVKSKGDVHFWGNYQELMKGMPFGPLSMVNPGKLFQGNFHTGTLNFENGKIVVESNSYYNKDVEAIFKENGNRKIDGDMIKQIPSDNVIAVLAASFKPQSIEDLLKLLGMDGAANAFLAEADLTLKDITSSTKGDIVFSFSDFSMKNVMDTMTWEGGGEPYVYSKPDINYNLLFSMSVADKNSFNKLVNTANEMIGKQGGKLPVDFKLSDKYFVVGNKPETVNEYLEGSKKEKSFLSKIEGHPVGFYCDLQRLFASVDTTRVPMFGDMSNSISVSKAFWQDIVAYGGDWKDGAVTSHFEINLVDQNTNSLKQLNQYLDKLAASDNK